MEMSATVVALDMTRPFTAARARNAGFARVIDVMPETDVVQFVDGDCEIGEGWLAKAAAGIEQDESVAVVCGRLRERWPEKTIYNRLCDIGWEYPLGDIPSCGGVAMYRASAFAKSGGFNEALVAGEERELCARVRAAGGRIVRIDADMGFHDADMTSLSQWWKRSTRTGWAYAAGVGMPGRAEWGSAVRRLMRSLGWGIVLPALFVVGVVGAVWSAWALVIVAMCVGGWCYVGWRVFHGRRRKGDSITVSILCGTFTLLGKLPEAQGVLRYVWERLSRRSPRLIEYRPLAKAK